MKTIYKYQLELKDTQSIRMPEQAQVLRVEVQAGALVVWAIVDNDAELVKRTFIIIGTGHDMERWYINPTKENYINTVFIGSLVWHVFDMGEIN